MSIPDWWILTLLTLGAFRLWRLLSVDTIFEKPRRWVVRLGPDWREEGDPVPDTYREYLAVWLMCPWCSGMWIAFAVWGAWQLWPHWTEVAMVPLAISTLVGLTRHNLDPPEE